MIRLEHAPRPARTCADCGGTTCDKACPSAAVIEHASVLAEIDAWEDHAANTYPDERWTA